MKVKRILKFYFAAASLENFIDGLILKIAAEPSEGLDGAERICALIEEKSELSGLWRYIDGVINTLTAEEKERLGEYAAMRRPLRSLEEGEKNAIRRAAVKFKRRARRLDCFTEGLRLAGKYYCILKIE